MNSGIIYLIYGSKRRLQLAKHKEIHNDENAKDYKKQIKVFHDKQIMRKSFAPG